MTRRGPGRSLASALAGVAALALAACGGIDGDDHPSVLGGTTTTTAADEPGCDVDGATSAAPAASVELTLSEFAVGLSSPSAPAGPVELVASNAGRIAHEVTVVRFAGDAGAIPPNPLGGADTAGLGDGAEVGKLWSFEPGATCRATFDLAPGRYALICNVVDDGTSPHYGQGMHTGFQAL